MNIWPFHSSVTLAKSGVFSGLTDYHSHLLPGVDDGVQRPEESLAILQVMENLGFSELWLTPHIMEDVPNSPEDLKARFEWFKKMYTGKIRLHLAAENMMDNLFLQRLADDDLLPIGEDQDMLLVETSYYNPPMNLTGILKQIQAKGYHPLLAHPERYEYMGIKEYKELKEMDIRFQLNLGALVGIYGPGVKKKAERLLKEGMYNLYGNDIHSLHFLQVEINGKVKKGIFK